MKVVLSYSLTLTIFIVGMGVMQSCGPKINVQLQKTYPPIAYDADVVVYQLKDTIPEDAELLGVVAVGEGGFTTRCSWYDVVNEAKLEARKSGGNAIKIISHKSPDFWSSCHRIEANILRIKNRNDE